MLKVISDPMIPAGIEFLSSSGSDSINDLQIIRELKDFNFIHVYELYILQLTNSAAAVISGMAAIVPHAAPIAIVPRAIIVSHSML